MNTINKCYSAKNLLNVDHWLLFTLSEHHYGVFNPVNLSLALGFKHNVHNNVAPDAAELASKQGNGLHNIGM